MKSTPSTRPRTDQAHSYQSSEICTAFPKQIWTPVSRKTPKSTYQLPCIWFVEKDNISLPWKPQQSRFLWATDSWGPWVRAAAESQTVAWDQSTEPFFSLLWSLCPSPYTQAAALILEEAEKLGVFWLMPKASHSSSWPFTSPEVPLLKRFPRKIECDQVEVQ